MTNISFDVSVDFESYFSNIVLYSSIFGAQLLRNFLRTSEFHTVAVGRSSDA